jgi:hypothetical protein
MTTQPTYAPPQRIVISDVDIPFWRLVVIFIKWTIAAIPAVIVVTILMAVVTGIITMLFGMGWMMLFRQM